MVQQALAAIFAGRTRRFRLVGDTRRLPITRISHVPLWSNTVEIVITHNVRSGPKPMHYEIYALSFYAL